MLDDKIIVRTVEMLDFVAAYVNSCLDKMQPPLVICIIGVNGVIMAARRTSEGFYILLDNAEQEDIKFPINVVVIDQTGEMKRAMLKHMNKH